MTTDKEMRFGFGKNWNNYIKKHFSEERAVSAQKHLLDFLEKKDLTGLDMIDIGCGSGLHALGAWRAGAKTIHAFDYDQMSVETTKMLHAYAGSPKNWTIEQGSILDDAYIQKMPKYDIVYSWGVLHHTGNLWKAVENAASLVKSGGLFYIALYDSVVASPSAAFWLEKKQAYNRKGWAGKRLMEAAYILGFYSGHPSLFQVFCAMPSRIKNTLVSMAHYRFLRGMSYYTDVKDWLGGWPMEYSSPDEVKEHVEKFGFKLTRVKTGEANAEYLFQRT